MSTKNIVPRTGSDGGKIGTDSKHWSEGHFDSITGSLLGDVVGNITGDISGDADTVDSKHATDFTLDYVTDNDNTTTNEITASAIALNIIGDAAGDQRIYLNVTPDVNATVIKTPVGTNRLKISDGGSTFLYDNGGNTRINIGNSADLILNSEGGDNVQITGSLFVSGSSRFGNELTDTHQFTGSFLQTGSGGTSVFNDRVEVVGTLSASYFEGINLTASGHVSASAFYGDFFGDGSGITGVTGDWDGQHDGDAGITGSLELSGSNAKLMIDATSSGVSLAIGGDLGLTDASNIKRISVVSTDAAFAGFGNDNDNRGYIGWDSGTLGGLPYLEIGTVQDGVSYPDTIIVDEGQVEVSGSLTVANSVYAYGTITSPSKGFHAGSSYGPLANEYLFMGPKNSLGPTIDFGQHNNGLPAARIFSESGSSNTGHLYISASNHMYFKLPGNDQIIIYNEGSDFVPPSNGGTLLVHGEDNVSEYIAMGVMSQSSGLGLPTITGGGIGTTPASLAFRTADAGVEAVRMLIDTTGSVGIGTATPDHTLTVVGDISASLSISASAFYGDGQYLTNLPGGSPGGQETYIQYNSGSAFTGSSKLYFNDTNNNVCSGAMLNTRYANITITNGYCPESAGLYSMDPAINFRVLGPAGTPVGDDSWIIGGNGQFTFNGTGSFTDELRVTGLLECYNNISLGGGQLWDSGHDLTTKTANFDIDWDDGMTQEVILSGTTATTLTASFSNIRPYATYQFINKIGKDNMELEFNQSIFWPGGVRPTLSNVSGSRDVITFTTDGDSNMYGVAQFNFSASVG